VAIKARRTATKEARNSTADEPEPVVEGVVVPAAVVGAVPVVPAPPVVVPAPPVDPDVAASCPFWVWYCVEICCCPFGF